MAAKKKTNDTLSPEELKAKRSAAAKKAAATRKANKAKREAEAAAAAANEPADAGETIAAALVAEDADAPPVPTDGEPDDPGERIDHAAFAEGHEDYDEPFEADPNAPGDSRDSLDEEALALVSEAVGGGKKKKKKAKKDKDKSKGKDEAKSAKAPKGKDKPGKKTKDAERDDDDDDAPGDSADPTAKLDVDKRADANEGRPTFAELGLLAPLQEAVADMGFEYPTVIQAQAIPILLGEETDLVKTSNKKRTRSSKEVSDREMAATLSALMR